jgi:glycosyltransferase involved in cell wall biosynthesis
MIGSSPEYIIDSGSGLFVPYGHVELFADAVTRLLQDGA